MKEILKRRCNLLCEMLNLLCENMYSKYRWTFAFNTKISNSVALSRNKVAISENDA